MDQTQPPLPRQETLYETGQGSGGVTSSSFCLYAWPPCRLPPQHPAPMTRAVAHKGRSGGEHNHRTADRRVLPRVLRALTRGFGPVRPWWRTTGQDRDRNPSPASPATRGTPTNRPLATRPRARPQTATTAT